MRAFGSHARCRIVIDPAVVERRLPASVMGAFYHVAGGEDARSEARAVHARFLSEFRLSRERFPLLAYDGSRFREAPG